MWIQFKNRMIVWLLLLIFTISGCQPAAPANTHPKTQVGKCGDGFCSGPENTINCPEDCDEEDKPVNEVDLPAEEVGPVYLGIMVHLEGWKDELFNEEMFIHHARLIREYASLFEAYGAKLTWESKEVTEASFTWGDNVLKEMEERGHGIGVHADLGGQLDYNCDIFDFELRIRKEMLESLGVTVRHVSGVVSHCDWVTALIDSGYSFVTGTVAYGVMSLPEVMRPEEYRNCPSPLACHDTYPEALADRIHPWRMHSGLDWIRHDPDGKLVMLPSSHGLACYAESAAGAKCDQDFTPEDIDLFFEELDAAVALRDPKQINMYYMSWSLGKALDAGLMEEWLQRIVPYVQAGLVEWKTLPEMYDAYIAWEN